MGDDGLNARPGMTELPIIPIPPRQSQRSGLTLGGDRTGLVSSGGRSGLYRAPKAKGIRLNSKVVSFCTEAQKSSYRLVSRSQSKSLSIVMEPKYPERETLRYVIGDTFLAASIQKWMDNFEIFRWIENGRVDGFRLQLFNGPEAAQCVSAEIYIDPYNKKDERTHDRHGAQRRIVDASSIYLSSIAHYSGRPDINRAVRGPLLRVRVENESEWKIGDKSLLEYHNEQFHPPRPSSQH